VVKYKIFTKWRDNSRGEVNDKNALTSQWMCGFSDCLFHGFKNYIWLLKNGILKAIASVCNN
jgi:hypothetical protein